MLCKPKMLYRGATIATISPSWGGAGDEELYWRYEQGIRRLKDLYDLNVVAMPNSLKGSAYLYEHPEARAQDLMDAFKNPEIDGIIANIGGDDSIRLLPYIDYDVIRKHPKVLMGYSDVTILHLICIKAGISSFYGPAIMTDFAENVQIPPYTLHAFEKTLFTSKPIGSIEPASEWTSEFIDWNNGDPSIKRQMRKNTGYEVLQGSGIVQGRLIGGCFSVLEFAKSTAIWPEASQWKESIMFLETSENKPSPTSMMYWLRNYAAQGILQHVNGIIIGKPQDETFYKSYKEVILKVMKEYKLTHIPILYNMNFGHTEPKFILPYGAMAEINCTKQSFRILESDVIA